MSRTLSLSFHAHLHCVVPGGSLAPQGDRYLKPLRKTDGVVYSKPPFDVPARVLAYLGRHTHRAAISDDRLLAIADGRVRFR